MQHTEQKQTSLKCTYITMATFNVSFQLFKFYTRVHWDQFDTLSSSKMFIKAILLGFLLTKVLITLCQLISTSLYAHIIQSPVSLSSNWVVLLKDLTLFSTHMLLSQVHVVTGKVSIILRIVWISGNIMLYVFFTADVNAAATTGEFFPVYLLLIIKIFNICYWNWSGHKRKVYLNNKLTNHWSNTDSNVPGCGNDFSKYWNSFAILLGSIVTMFWRNTLGMTFILVIALPWISENL